MVESGDGGKHEGGERENVMRKGSFYRRKMGANLFTTDMTVGSSGEDRVGGMDDIAADPVDTGARSVLIVEEAITGTEEDAGESNEATVVAVEEDDEEEEEEEEEEDVDEK